MSSVMGVYVDGDDVGAGYGSGIAGAEIVAGGLGFFAAVRFFVGDGIVAGNA